MIFIFCSLDIAAARDEIRIVGSPSALRFVQTIAEQFVPKVTLWTKALFLLTIREETRARDQALSLTPLAKK